MMLCNGSIIQRLLPDISIVTNGQAMEEVEKGEKELL